ncbi:MAG: FAD binding domain-containing protein [Rhodospirillaceae bacterium]|nr:FAD binding domain-containing protein [Rhodospirillaceae bacterium]
MKPAPFTHLRADSAAAAAALLAEAPEDSRIVSGGQSLGPLLNFRLAAPSRLVDVSRAADLRGAALEGDVLRIGAGVTHAMIEDGKIPDATKGLMRHVARGIAYRPVRNRGTIGGSLAHADPAADWVSTMMALDARVRLAGRSDKREIAVTDFVTGALTTALEPGEMVQAVLVPRLSAEARWGHAKFARKQGDFADSMAIAVFDPARGFARVVLGRRAEPPALLTETARAADQQHGPIDHAIEADLGRLGIDPVDLPLHRAMAGRAIRDAWA